jgi:sugar lactone lactonase YvrE
MDWGPDGKLYAPMPDMGQIVRLDVDASPLGIEPVVAGLKKPVAVKFDSKNQLHAIDNITGQIWRINHQTGAKELFATTSAGLDNLAFDSADRLFIANSITGVVGQVYKNGGVRALNRKGMSQPGGIAVLPQKYSIGSSVFVADVYSLREYDSITGWELSVHGEGSGIYYPLTVAPQGENLILTSWFANAVQIWDPKNKKILKNHFEFSTPINAISFQGDLIVAELGTVPGAARLLRVGTDQTTTLADVSNYLYVPAGLAADDTRLWVSDAATGMVWQVAAAGTLVPVASGLAGPEGLALDKQGNLLVVEAGANRLSRINLQTGVVSTVKEGLQTGATGIPGTPPTFSLNGVAVNKYGTIFATGDRGNVVFASRFGF